MDHFFAKNFTGGEFAFMGTAHLIALLSIVLLNFYLLRYKSKSESDRSRIRWTMAIVLWAGTSGTPPSANGTYRPCFPCMCVVCWSGWVVSCW